VDGKSLTGDLVQGQSRLLKVSDGTISGNRIAFKVLVPENRTVSFAGILDGDENRVRANGAGAWKGAPLAAGKLFGAGGAPSFVAKRVGK
jgi:hypothetical protein